MAPLVTEDIKDPAKLLGTDLIIAVMGSTGSGKSNFIDTLTNQPGRRTGSRLESCTNEIHVIRLYNHPAHGDRLVLVEMPALDNATKSDLEILETISKWLQKVCEKKIRLTGIIYLHRITDRGMFGSTHRNFLMCGGLCGDQAVKKVVLVTTMWDNALASASDSQREALVKREKNLMDNYWKTMTKHGASTARFTNTRASAEEIVSIILQQHEAEVLLLQEEIVDLRIPFHETQAAKSLYSDLQKLLVEQRDTVRALAQQVRNEHNPQLVRQLETELKLIQRDFDKTFNKVKEPTGKKIFLFYNNLMQKVRS